MGEHSEGTGKAGGTERLLELAEPLYAGPPADFTARRDAVARACTDKPLARRLKALRRPTAAAAALNHLVRHEAEQIDRVLELAASLREAAAAMQGDELRALTRQRRQLTAALAAAARSRARQDGARLSDSVVDQVEQMLSAAMLDPVAADVVRSGLVIAAFTSTGLDALDVTGVLAVPEALGGRAPAAPVHQAPAGRGHLRMVEPDPEVLRATARERVEEAEADRDRAQASYDEVAGSLETLRARRLHLQGDLDELRRRTAELEEAVDGVDDDLEEADEALDEADGVLAQARARHADAEAALDGLGSPRS